MNATLAAQLRMNCFEVEFVPGKRGRVLVAGPHQFKSLWVRDFCFSVPGACRADLYDEVEHSFEAILCAQRPSGELPRLLDDRSFALRVFLGALFRISLPLKGLLRPNYSSENGVESVDTILLVIRSVFHFFEQLSKVGQVDRCERLHARWLPFLSKAMQHFESQFVIEPGCVGNQPPFSDWADSLARRGSVAYTQVLYVLALQSWAKKEGSTSALIAEKAGHALHVFRSRFYVETELRIRSCLVDESVESVPSHIKRFDADAYFLALSEGFFNPVEARSLLEHLAQKAPALGALPLGRCAWPDYPRCDKSLYTRLVGVSGYHDQLEWVWLNVLLVRAEFRAGLVEQAGVRKRTLADLIIAHEGRCHEVYRGAVPFRSFAYRAEAPFTWSTSMLLDLFSEFLTES